MEALYKELYNVQVFTLETPIPPINKINITVSEPGLLNTNPKLVMVA